MTELEIINAIREVWGDRTRVRITVTRHDVEVKAETQHSWDGMSYQTLNGEWSPPVADGED